MKVTVSVELSYSVKDETTARELARQAVESRGLTVSRVAVSKPKGEGKAWNPKAGKPGAPVVCLLNGETRRFQVWDEAPMGGVWVVPEGRRESDAPVYHYNGGHITRYHGDGKACVTRWEHARTEQGTPNWTAPRVEVPCSHPSHKRSEAAA